MEVYLIRHTTPAIEKGTCYGQADLDITDSFEQEAQCIRPHLPAYIRTVYSSPLQRCRKLAEYLFPEKKIVLEDRLKEISCGDWELKLWDDIEPVYLKKWMDDSIHTIIPGGESYMQLYSRVRQFFDRLPLQQPVAIVSHGGVMRSLLSYINNITLKDSFDAFSIRYGCVIKVEAHPQGWRHAVLHNPASEKEQHRPSYY